MYHLCKQSRLYSGMPYCGPSSSYATAESETIEGARVLANWLNSVNPVGWDVYDAETQLCVYKTNSILAGS